MARPYNPKSVRNRPGLTIRPTAADRQLIAAWAKRWGCGVGEAAARLAVMGAEVGMGESAVGRTMTVTEWLVDGLDYFDVLMLAEERWGLTDDEIHRLVDPAMAMLPSRALFVEDAAIRAKQIQHHALRACAVYRFGSLACATRGRAYGYRVLMHDKRFLVDVLTTLDQPLTDQVPALMLQISQEQADRLTANLKIRGWGAGRSGFKVF